MRNKFEKTILEENVEYGVMKNLEKKSFKDKYFFDAQPAGWSRESVTKRGDKILKRADKVIYESPADAVFEEILTLPRDWLKGLIAHCDVRWLPDGRYALISFNDKIFIFDRISLKVRKRVKGLTCGWFEQK